jgi:hypothetical protein
MLLKPDLFKSMTSPLDVDKLIKQDIKNSAGKNVEYIAVKNIKIGSKVASLFFVTEKAKAWEPVLKALKPASLAMGECRVVKGQGSKLEVAVKSATGASKADVMTIAKTAIKDFNPIDFAEYLARESNAKVGNFKVDNATFTQMVKVSNELSEYNKFAAAFHDMGKKYKLTDQSDYKKVPVNIWAELLKGLVKSGYVNEKIPKAADGKSFVLAYTGNDGKIVREAVLAQAMTGLQKYTAHASAYLDKVVAEVRKAGGKPTWSFWSGSGAQDAAKKENSGGVVLEGSIGSWFDKVWDFKPLTGVENLALWTSMSELYAQKAAQYYDAFSFRGYVGQGATRDQSVFNKIEQPTFIQVLNVKKTVDVPNVEWFVVDCVQDGDRWNGSGKPSIKFASRDAALAEVKKRYGG